MYAAMYVKIVWGFDHFHSLMYKPDRVVFSEAFCCRKEA